MKKLITLSVLFSILLTSCYVTRTTVGYGPVGESLHTRTYSVAKQRYVLFGLVRLPHTNPKTPPSGVGFEVKSSFTFVDGIITMITGGIYGQRTVKILVEKEVEKELQNGQPQKIKP